MPDIYWQQIPMLHRGGAFSFGSRQGLAAWTGWIDVPAKNLEALRVEPSLAGFFRRLDGTSGEDGTVERPPVGAVVHAVEGKIPDGDLLDVVGELVLDGGNGDVVRFRDVYLSPRGVRVVEPSEAEGELVGPICRIDLVGIGFWWGRRGTAPAGHWNIPRSDGLPGFEQGSHDPLSGGPHRLPRRMQDLQDRLPGSPGMGRFPPDLEAELPTGKEWAGVELAAAELGALAERYGLRPCMDLSGRINYWRPNEGPLGEGDGNGGALHTASLVERTVATSFSFPPAAVEVVGAPILREKRASDLEPVGQLDGKVVELETALRQHGFTLAQGGEWVLQSAENRGRGLTPRSVAELEEWAFRWYRIRQPRRRFLPLQPRLDVDEAGRRLPILVRADSYGAIPEEQPKPSSGEAEGEEAPPKPERPETSLPDPEERRIERQIRDARQRLEAYGAPSDETAEREVVALQEGLASLIGVLKQAQAAPAAPRPDGIPPKFRNLPMVEVNKGDFDIDEALGVVKFKKPRGTLRFLRVDQLEKSQLEPAAVEVVFAYEDKPDLGAPPETPEKAAAHRYRYRAVWTASGPSRVDKISSDRHVTPVPAPKLVRKIWLDGRDNVADLDREAAAIAASVLDVPGRVVGESLLFASFRHIEVNGRVKSVSWASDGRTCHTAVEAGPGGAGSGASSRQLRRIYGEETVVRPPAGWNAPGPDDGYVTEVQRRLVSQAGELPSFRDGP